MDKLSMTLEWDQDAQVGRIEFPDGQKMAWDTCAMILSAAIEAQKSFHKDMPKIEEFIKTPKLTVEWCPRIQRVVLVYEIGLLTWDMRMMMLSFALDIAKFNVNATRMAHAQMAAQQAMQSDMLKQRIMRGHN